MARKNLQFEPGKRPYSVRFPEDVMKLLTAAVDELRDDGIKLSQADAMATAIYAFARMDTESRKRCLAFYRVRDLTAQAPDISIVDVSEAAAGADEAEAAAVLELSPKQLHKHSEKNATG